MPCPSIRYPHTRFCPSIRHPHARFRKEHRVLAIPEQRNPNSLFLDLKERLAQGSSRRVTMLGGFTCPLCFWGRCQAYDR